MTRIPGEAPPPVAFTEGKEILESIGKEALSPTNAAYPYGSVLVESDSEDGIIYKLVDGQVELVRIRTLQQLEAQGIKGRGFISGLISRLNKFVSNTVGGPIVGWYLYYRLIRRGRKATLAVDLHNATFYLDEDQFRRNLDLLAEAFPTFVAAVANSKARVEGAPLMARIPDDKGERRWTLMLDCEVPEVEVPELDCKLNPRQNWIASKAAVVIFLVQPATIELIKRLDKAAAAVYREASRYHAVPGNKEYKALKTGLKRDLARLRNDPVRLTRVLIRPMLGAIDLIPDILDDRGDLDPSDLALPVELHGYVTNGADLIASADALGRPDHPFAGVEAFDQASIRPSSESGNLDYDDGHHVSERGVDVPTDMHAENTSQVHFSGAGCDCGYNPNNCGAGHFCRWQY